MKRLLIRSCLIAGLVCAASCASNKETAVQEPAAAPVMQPEQTAAAAQTAGYPAVRPGRQADYPRHPVIHPPEP